MSNHPFAVSLNPFVQVKSAEDYYTLHSAESDPTAWLTLATTPGIGIALDRLKAGNTTTASLVQGLAELDGRAAGEEFALTLQQLDERGWLSYAVLPLAVAIPMVATAKLDPSESDWVHTSIGLSPSASLRPYAGVMVLESPDSQFKVKLLDWRANALLAQLAEPKPLAKLTPPPHMGPETAYQFLNLLRAAGFLTTDHREPPSFRASGLDESMVTTVANASGKTEEVAAQLNEVDDALTATQVLEAEMLGDEADVVATETEPADGDAATPTTEALAFSTDAAIQAGEVTAETTELDALEDGLIEVTDTDSLDAQAEPDAEHEPVALVASIQTTNDAEVESSATKLSLALHPHDLDDRIPGLAELHNQTLGDPRITIVIIDGDPDHTLSCFAGAQVSKVFPYWHEPADPISPEHYAAFQAIRDKGLKGKDKQAAIEAALPEDVRTRVELNDHATHVTSIIVGQEHSPVFGVAPKCRVINMPQDAIARGNYEDELSNYNDVVSALNLARALELGLELGANIIHCAFCRATQTSVGEEILVQAIKKCQDNNILIVAPVGNNSNKSWCLPAVLPGVLAVGAAKVDGTPAHFSNWGGNNTQEGILAPGEDVLGAQPCTEKPVRLTGSSMAAPVMTGISALLMSLQLQEGKPIDAEAVRMALLNTAIPCDPEKPERCLRGFVNIPGATRVLFGQPSLTISFAGDRVIRTERAGYAAPVASHAPPSTQEVVASAAMPAVLPATPAEEPVTAAATPADTGTVEASTAFSGNVYALGTIGYDFGDETRRDTFQQQMAPAEVNGIMVPADPYDARQMVEHLDRNPDEGRSLIWTLSLDGDTIYVLESTAGDVYEMFVLMLAGQLEPEASDDFVERISIPARRTNRTVELSSGEVVPVVTVPNPRGMYGWKVNTLVNSAMAAISRQVDEAQEPLVRQALTAFLNRVYNDLRNVGQTSRDRALNFAATNIFQAAVTFARAIVEGRQLDTINVEKSPFCRINSDCWDVKLEFYDPDSSRRGRKVFRFTLDVVLLMPVTLGEVRSWSIPAKGSSTQR